MNKDLATAFREWLADYLAQQGAIHTLPLGEHTVRLPGNVVVRLTVEQE